MGSLRLCRHGVIAQTNPAYPLARQTAGPVGELLVSAPGTSANLGRVNPSALLEALEEILVACQQLLRPGGVLVLTARPYRHRDLLGPIEADVGACRSGRAGAATRRRSRGAPPSSDRPATQRGTAGPACCSAFSEWPEEGELTGLGEQVVVA